MKLSLSSGLVETNVVMGTWMKTFIQVQKKIKLSKIWIEDNLDIWYYEVSKNNDYIIYLHNLGSVTNTEASIDGHLSHC